MRQFLIAMSASVFFFSTACAAPPDAHCDDATWRTAASISDLPEQIQTGLGRFRHDHSGMADAGEAFNSSDAIINDAAPMSRFVSARMGEKCIHVRVERGGRGYHEQELIFERAEGAWRQIVPPLPRPSPAAG